jgi:hypothetical protein
LANALTLIGNSGSKGPDRLVFEAPAFRETLAFTSTTVAAFSTLPNAVLNLLARSFLMDDLRTSEVAATLAQAFVPGRTSRAVFNMNVLALVNPLNRAPIASAELLDKSWFVGGEFDRLIDHDHLTALLDRWQVRAERRLVLPRNHLLAVTSPREILDWLEGS